MSYYCHIYYFYKCYKPKNGVIIPSNNLMFFKEFRRRKVKNVHNVSCFTMSILFRPHEESYATEPGPELGGRTVAMLSSPSWARGFSLPISLGSIKPSHL